MQRLLRKIKGRAELICLCFLLGFCLAMLQAPRYSPATQTIASRDMAFPSGGVSLHGIMTVATHQDLDQVFSAQDYNLRDVYAGSTEVPPIFLTRLPTDLHLIEQPKDKKEIFIQSILPLVLLVNDHIADSRKRLFRVWEKQSRGEKLTDAESDFIAKLSDEYGVPDRNFEKLAMRVDIIPPSLAIAQAAEESGWGTSRFVQHGNALFGQQVYNSEEGIVPQSRDGGRQHLVKRFDNLFATVLSYSRNLNTHNAYSDFRAKRAQMRNNRQYMDSVQLIESLESYSERRGHYVQTIKRIIRSNDLQALDRARLDAASTDYWRQRLI